MRIVAGKFRGKNLTKSDHLKLRPTTDKNREALFNILTAGKLDFEIDGAKVLDICCGTGAVGFEALSRGAESVVFVDNSRPHLDLVKKNSEILGVKNQVEIIFSDAKKLPKNEKSFDLVFIDPPYEEDYEAIISNLLQNNWLQKNSLIVIERSSEKNPLQSFDFLQLDSRKYGATVFEFYKLS